jgi:hypothetical protein
MARRPEDRPPTPGALAELLAPFADPDHVARVKRRGGRALAVLAALALLTAVATAGVMRLPAGKDREVVIETDDPDVEVVAKGDRIVRIVDPKSGKAYHLDREDLTLSLADDPDGLTVALDGKGPVVLKRRGKRIATVRLAPKHGAGGARRAGRLFNGKDLTGWVADGGRRGAWRVEDGDLVGTCPECLDSGYLLTERAYQDFHLRFEFQLSAGANSGVALRALPGEREDHFQSVPKHLEVQILDDAKYRKPDGTVPGPRGRCTGPRAAPT